MSVPDYPYKATVWLEKPYLENRHEICEWIKAMQLKRARHPVDSMVLHGILSVTLYSQYEEDHVEFTLRWT